MLDQTLLPKIFGYFASRYAQRPGGYTRIHKFGNRFGDNAPHAVLELVDNPRDIKLEMTARAVGWELLKERIQTGDVSELVQKGVDGADELIAKELALEPRAVGQLRPATRWNLQKIMRYREPSEYLEIVKKAQGHIVSLCKSKFLAFIHNSTGFIIGEACTNEDAAERSGEECERSGQKIDFDRLRKEAYHLLP